MECDRRRCNANGLKALRSQSTQAEEEGEKGIFHVERGRSFPERDFQTIMCVFGDKMQQAKEMPLKTLMTNSENASSFLVEKIKDMQCTIKVLGSRLKSTKHNWPFATSY